VNTPPPPAFVHLATHSSLADLPEYCHLSGVDVCYYRHAKALRVDHPPEANKLTPLPPPGRTNPIIFCKLGCR